MNDPSRGIDRGLIELFEEQVEKGGDRCAIEFKGSRVTYVELNRAANSIAWLLREVGAGRDQIVAVVMDRCVDAYAAMLGVLKAGAAYLPVDPANPRGRIKYFFEQSRPCAVLTKSGFLHLAEAEPETHAILLDEAKPFQKGKKRRGRLFDGQDVRERSGESPPHTSGGRDLAYVIFTSGSTGVPKGVLIEQRSVVNLAGWAGEAFGVKPQSRVAQTYSIAFDAAVQEVFTALLSGATLVPVPDEVRTNPPRLLDWLREKAISYWDTVPSVWYSIVDYLKAREREERLVLPNLETLVLGGEVLHADRVRTWMDRVERNHRLYNVYGPTEATVSATCFEVREAEPGKTVLIGQPIWNTVVFIMDEEGHVCPPGVEGEIYLGGAGLARGYLNEPEVTESAFVDGLIPGQRLYRTGDFGRRHVDGNVEFRGRRDDQVKVRGYRIDLREIEAAIRVCPGVTEVRLAVDDGAEGKRKIVAFYVAQNPVTPDEARGYVKEKLPWFMIPHQFVRVMGFPLTPGGKTDKAALLHALRDGRNEQRGLVHRGAVSTTEAILAVIWRETLGVDEVRGEDNFFSLGGDSLLTVKVQLRCEQEGIRISPIDVMRHPTLAELARHIEDSARTDLGPREDEEPVVVIPWERRRQLPPNTEKVLPLLGMQKEMLAACERQCGMIYLPQVILRCEGTIDLGALEKAVNVLISRHEALRTVFKRDLTGEPVQLVLSNVRYQIPFEDMTGIQADGAVTEKAQREDARAVIPTKHQVRLSREGGAANQQPTRPEIRARRAHVERAADAIVRRGFELSCWPLFNLTVYKLSETLFEVVWTVHHLIMDGWSMSIFYRELSHLYSCAATKRFRPLARLCSNFSDVVQGTLRRSADDARRYWARRLANAGFFKLPSDRDASREENRAIKSYGFSLSVKTTNELKRFARQCSVTLSTVGLAAYSVFLKEVTQQGDVTIGVLSGGRTAGIVGVEKVIGNLVNIVPLRLNPTGRTTFAELVRAAHCDLCEAIAYEHLDPGEIAKLTGAEAYSLPLEALFVADNYPSPAELGFEGFESFEVTEITARECNHYPLTLVSTEGAGRLVFSFEYAAHRFATETVQAWSRRLLDILRLNGHWL